MIQHTSLLSFQEIQSKLGAKQKQVLDALRNVPNATNAELSKMLGWPINTVTPRCLELRKMEIVVEAEHRRCKVTGRTAIAWKTVLKNWPASFEPKSEKVEIKQQELFSA